MSNRAKIPPWAHGPFELIQHANSHYCAGTDTDRRIALIGFDNALEVAITAYLQLHPKQRGGATYERARVDAWLRNYHTKLEFLESFTAENDLPIAISTAEISWYHRLRNEIYHAGNGLVPEIRHVTGLRAAAVEVLRLLFGIEVETVLESLTTGAVLEIDRPASATLSGEASFLEAFSNLEHALGSTAEALGVAADGRADGITRLWPQLTATVGAGVFRKHAGDVERARRVRDALVHKGTSDCPTDELRALTSTLREATRQLAKIPESPDLIGDLRRRYGDWVAPHVCAVRIVRHSGRLFFEVNSRVNDHDLDEVIRRIDLSFISGFGLNEANAVVSTDESAAGFFDALDLYSLVMTGLAELLFAPAGIEEAARVSGALGGEPRGSITRWP